MMNFTAELVLDSHSALGEGPIWDNERQILYWVDILGSSLNAYDPVRQENIVHDIGQNVGTVVPAKEPGKVMLAVYEGFARYDLDKQELTLLHNPEAHLPQNRFNDGKCDPAERFWAGTIAVNGRGKHGSLYCLETDGHVRKVLGDIGISNGLGWSLDGTLMYFIDTNRSAVRAFDFDAATGKIKNGRDAIRVPKEMGFPDGMTIDAEGMLWIALWGGGQVCRWNPNNGELLQSVGCPVSQTTACAFGGKAKDILFITSASIGLSEEKLKKEPHAGGLFAVEAGCKGVPAYRFGG